MYIRVNIGVLTQTETVQGVHSIANVLDNGSIRIRCMLPANASGKDLTPDLYTHSSYLVRVPPPNASAYDVASIAPKKPDAKSDCPAQDDEEEIFTPYRHRVAVARDIPASLRTAPDNVQAFWEKSAPKRGAHDLKYPGMMWDEFEAGLKAQCSGEKDSLFGAFDFTDAARKLQNLKTAIGKHCPGGALPASNRIPPAAFARFVAWAAVELPPAPSEEIAEMYPQWLAEFLPPSIQDEDTTMQPCPLVSFQVMMSSYTCVYCAYVHVWCVCECVCTHA
jgi:hypothetical protein